MFWGCFYVPNITGEFAQNYKGGSGGWHMSNGVILSGVFEKGGKTGSSCTWSYYGDDYSLKFRANKANNRFGKSSTIQPSSTRALCLVRT